MIERLARGTFDAALKQPHELVVSKHTLPVSVKERQHPGCVLLGHADFCAVDLVAYRHTSSLQGMQKLLQRHKAIVVEVHAFEHACHLGPSLEERLAQLRDALHFPRPELGDPLPQHHFPHPLRGLLLLLQLPPSFVPALRRWGLGVRAHAGIRTGAAPPGAGARAGSSRHWDTAAKVRQEVACWDVAAAAFAGRIGALEQLLHSPGREVELQLCGEGLQGLLSHRNIGAIWPPNGNRRASHALRQGVRRTGMHLAQAVAEPSDQGRLRSVVAQGRRLGPHELCLLVHARLRCGLRQTVPLQGRRLIVLLASTSISSAAAILRLDPLRGVEVAVVAAAAAAAAATAAEAELRAAVCGLQGRSRRCGQAHGMLGLCLRLGLGQGLPRLLQLPLGEPRAFRVVEGGLQHLHIAPGDGILQSSADGLLLLLLRQHGPGLLEPLLVDAGRLRLL
mmetsp:Transcript_102725/g.329350  ORF Transcript_102725/g.329350 Transcript_102725/m.329350 type:complete len:450 (-) Transcript_102725:2722-4071(-)